MQQVQGAVEEQFEEEPETDSENNSDDDLIGTV